jgi:hypothetical protein
MKRLFPYLLAFSLAAAFWSCNKEKSGLIDPQLNTPSLISATLGRTSFNLDSTDADITPLPGRRFKIQCAVNAIASAPYNPKAISRVTYKVLLPGSDKAIASGSLSDLIQGQPLTDSAYWVRASGTISFTVDYYEAGIYHVDFTAIDANNAASNTITLWSNVTRRDIKPQLSNLVVPDTVIRPTTGLNLYLFTVAASDSDGHNDLKRVFFYRIAPDTSANIIDMYDDGDLRTDGDKVAGDGIFSVIVQINPSAPLQVQRFLFRAQDSAGLLSDSLTHTITITR